MIVQKIVSRGVDLREVGRMFIKPHALISRIRYMCSREDVPYFGPRGMGRSGTCQLQSGKPCPELRREMESE